MEIGNVFKIPRESAQPPVKALHRIFGTLIEYQLLQRFWYCAESLSSQPQLIDQYKLLRKNNKKTISRQGPILSSSQRYFIMTFKFST